MKAAKRKCCGPSRRKDPALQVEDFVAAVTVHDDVPAVVPIIGPLLLLLCQRLFFFLPLLVILRLSQDRSRAALALDD